jgi:spore maturation protein CgeB
MGMIDETILFLTHTDCGMPALKRYGLGIGPNADFDSLFVQPLRKVFSEVIVYDMWKNYAEIGVRKSNEEIIDIVHTHQPKYLLWPSMMYEIMEFTFQKIRERGTLVVGWFFDDEIRFDDYSRWWSFCLDYCLTTDKESVKKYEELGCTAIHALPVSNPAIFRKLDLSLLYDVTFIGRKFGDRGIWIEQLRARGINTEAFGKGWSKGYVSTEQMVKIYNASKINLCFVKSYGMNTRPQMKDKIFNVCMSGGFLLCEYIQGIEALFEIDKEIVCFKDLEDATAKIQYYLSHETERLVIAQAGWERAQRDHTQASMLLNVFGKIEENAKVSNGHVNDCQIQLDMPSHIRHLPSSYHLNWAKALMIESFPDKRWQEELDIALFYDPDNKEALRLRQIGRLPTPLRRILFCCSPACIKLKQLLRSYLASIPMLRKIKRALIS